jgi:hypothetical protein
LPRRSNCLQLKDREHVGEIAGRSHRPLPGRDRAVAIPCGGFGGRVGAFARAVGARECVCSGPRLAAPAVGAAPASSLAAPPARHPAPAHPRRHRPRHCGRGPVSWWRLRRAGGGLRICAREVGAREDVGGLQLFSRRPGGCALPIARSATHRTATFPAQMAFRPVECSLDVNGSLV